MPQFTEDFYPASAQARLAELARSVTIPGAWVEVGCWEGRSTCVLANVHKPEPVHAVDHWQGSEGDSTLPLAKLRDVHAAFAANVQELTEGNVIEHRMSWEQFFADFDEPLALLHIDGTHSAKQVHDNLGAAKHLWRPGTLVIGDDWQLVTVQTGATGFFGTVEHDARTWWHRVELAPYPPSASRS